MEHDDGFLEVEDVLSLAWESGEVIVPMTVTEKLMVTADAAMAPFSFSQHVDLTLQNIQQKRDERHMAHAAQQHGEGLQRKYQLKALMTQVVSENLSRSPEHMTHTQIPPESETPEPSSHNRRISSYIALAQERTAKAAGKMARRSTGSVGIPSSALLRGGSIDGGKSWIKIDGGKTVVRRASQQILMRNSSTSGSGKVFRGFSDDVQIVGEPVAVKEPPFQKELSMADDLMDRPFPAPDIRISDTGDYFPSPPSPPPRSPSPPQQPQSPEVPILNLQALRIATPPQARAETPPQLDLPSSPRDPQEHGVSDSQHQIWPTLVRNDSLTPRLVPPSPTLATALHSLDFSTLSRPLLGTRIHTHTHTSPRPLSCASVSIQAPVLSVVGAGSFAFGSTIGSSPQPPSHHGQAAHGTGTHQAGHSNGHGKASSAHPPSQAHKGVITLPLGGGGTNGAVMILAAGSGVNGVRTTALQAAMVRSGGLSSGGSSPVGSPRDRSSPPRTRATPELLQSAAVSMQANSSNALLERSTNSVPGRLNSSRKGGVSEHVFEKEPRKQMLVCLSSAVAGPVRSPLNSSGGGAAQSSERLNSGGGNQSSERSQSSLGGGQHNPEEGVAAAVAGRSETTVNAPISGVSEHQVSFGVRPCTAILPSHAETRISSPREGTDGTCLRGARGTSGQHSPRIQRNPNQHGTFSQTMSSTPPLVPVTPAPEVVWQTRGLQQHEHELHLSSLPSFIHPVAFISDMGTVVSNSSDKEGKDTSSSSYSHNVGGSSHSGMPTNNAYSGYATGSSGDNSPIHTIKSSTSHAHHPTHINTDSLNANRADSAGSPVSSPVSISQHPIPSHLQQRSNTSSTNPGRTPINTPTPSSGHAMWGSSDSTHRRSESAEPDLKAGRARSHATLPPQSRSDVPNRWGRDDSPQQILRPPSNLHRHQADPQPEGSSPAWVQESITEDGVAPSVQAGHFFPPTNNLSLQATLHSTLTPPRPGSTTLNHTSMLHGARESGLEVRACMYLWTHLHPTTTTLPRHPRGVRQLHSAPNTNSSRSAQLQNSRGSSSVPHIKAATPAFAATAEDCPDPPASPHDPPASSIAPSVRDPHPHGNGHSTSAAPPHTRSSAQNERAAVVMTTSEIYGGMSNHLLAGGHNTRTSGHRHRRTPHGKGISTDSLLGPTVTPLVLQQQQPTHQHQPSSSSLGGWDPTARFHAFHLPQAAHKPDALKRAQTCRPRTVPTGGTAGLNSTQKYVEEEDRITGWAASSATAGFDFLRDQGFNDLFTPTPTRGFLGVCGGSGASHRGNSAGKALTPTQRGSSGR